MRKIMMITALLIAFAGMQSANATSPRVDMLGSFGSGFTAPNVAGTSSIPTPSSGDIIFNTVDSTFYGSDGTTWTAFGGGSGASVPTGAISAYAGTTAPTGYLLCNGAAVSRTTYAALFAVIGTSFGQGDGSSTFNLPDFRGQFLRGRDGGAGKDPNASTRIAMNTGGNTGDAIGSVQGHAFQTHTHIQDAHSHGFSYAFSNDGGGSVVRSGATVVGSGSTGSTTATNQNAQASGTNSQASTSETRPLNAYVNYLIKI
jgi:microcystin-dependent protein